MLTCLYFLDGFNKAYFHDHFNFLLKNDPVLGKNTYGQLARFGQERCFVMHKGLCVLEEKWAVNFEGIPEFEPYAQALEGIDKGNLKFFRDATKVFLERYRYIFEKHMVAKWLGSTTHHYILGGDKYHAREWARWMINYRENVRGADEENEGLDDAFTFTNVEVELGDHHKMTHGCVKVNLRESMEWITSEADREIILKDDFVDKNWDLIEKLAVSEEPINLLGLLRKELRSELKDLAETIFGEVCVHSNHQQRAENYVQLSGLLSLTGVGEVRRTCRAISIAAIIRRFNIWALEISNARRLKEDEDTVKRLQGSEKDALFLRYLHRFFGEVDEAIDALGEERWKQLNERLTSSDAKASALDRDALLMEFERALKKRETVYAAELPAGVEKTARVGGGVYLRLLTEKNNMKETVHAEIEARKIKMSDRQKEKLTLAEKRKKLRKHELSRRNEEFAGYSKNAYTDKDINWIKPMSRELQERMLDSGLQAKILDKEAGNLSAENESNASIVQTNVDT